MEPPRIPGRATGLRGPRPLPQGPKPPPTGAVRVLWGKGGWAWTMGLDPGAFRLVEFWARHRAALGLDARHPLFCTGRGEPITSSYIRRLLNRLGEQAGIEKRVHATQLRSEGVDIGIISKQLGHRSIAAAARYLDHIAPRAVVAALSGREC